MRASTERVIVVGGGLAGAEAAWQLAARGLPVELFEMRPIRQTEVHKTDLLAELVCSNSLRADSVERAQGLLKEELRRLGSLILCAADATRIAGGAALVVDRGAFATHVTQAITNHPLITLRRQEVPSIPEAPVVVIATGPLTSPALADSIIATLGEGMLHFYDAVSPIVAAETVDCSIAWQASRYDKGEAAYLNCPFDREQYLAFRGALLAAEKAPLHDCEKTEFFEGCLPIEELAARGDNTMRFGPMKPTGLTDPRTGRRPYAVVQLRPENAAKTMYNLVGFQTRLLWLEQERVFRQIPGLEGAEFLRYGVVHRNTFLNAPKVLEPTYECRDRLGLFFAGQLTGVEGYVESAASGLVAGINAAHRAKGEPPAIFPVDTIIGTLAQYIASADPDHFQPMNANFGLLPPLEGFHPKRADVRKAMVERALEALTQFWGRFSEVGPASDDSQSLSAPKESGTPAVEAPHQNAWRD